MNCLVFSQRCLVDRTLNFLQSCVVILEYYFLFKLYLFSGKGKLLQICKFVNSTLRVYRSIDSRLETAVREFCNELSSFIACVLS